MQQTLTIPGQLPSFTQISKSSRYDKTSKETTVAIDEFLKGKLSWRKSTEEASE